MKEEPKKLSKAELRKMLSLGEEASSITIVKIGGKVIDDLEALDAFLTDFAAIEGYKILVHGGGKVASDFGKRLGIEPNYVEGRRITDTETLELVTMVYAGLVNKKIVAKLQAVGENAIGLTGADANILRAEKRPVGEIDYGYVGDVSEAWVSIDQVAQFLKCGLTPVMCPLTHDGEGNLLNTNADTVANVLSNGLSRIFDTALIYCFEQKGVLSDFENQTVIPEIDTSSYKRLKEDGTVSEGMIPKLDNAFNALESGVERVVIGHFSEVRALVSEEGVGTTIRL